MFSNEKHPEPSCTDASIQDVEPEARESETITGGITSQSVGGGASSIELGGDGAAKVGQVHT